MTASLAVAGEDNTSSAEVPAGSRNPKAAVIRLDGEIDSIMGLWFKRALKKAKESNPSAYVFVINSWGGAVYEADEISNAIMRIDDAWKAAFIEEKAISGGIYIAVAANEIVMQNGTKIGDSQPIFQTMEGIQEGPEKVQSPIRAHFRAAAQKNGWPSALAEAMVSPDIEVFEITFDNGTRVYDKPEGTGSSLEKEKGMDYDEKIGRLRTRYEKEGVIRDIRQVVAPGELLTMTSREAVRYGFCRTVAGSVEEYVRVLEKRNGVKYDIVRIENNWWEDFCEFLISPTMKLVFLVIGVLGIYIELKIPGFGAPGIIGIIALALLVFAHHLFGLAEMYEIAFIAIGIALVALELFVIPGFGVAGISGMLLILVGVILSFQNFTLPESPLEYQFFRTNLIVVFTSIIIFFVLAVALAKFLPKSNLFSRLMLVSPTGRRTLSRDPNRRAEDRSALVGKSGEARSPLRPAGKAFIEGKYYDVVTEGDFVDNGSRVRVMKISGNRIVVVKVEDEA